jgi:hypothetical protein
MTCVRLLSKKAQWDQIEKDLTETYKQLKKDQDKMSLDELWNIFKTNVQETIHKYIPTKSIGNKSRLPWVNNQLKKLINKKNKLYKKKKDRSQYFKTLPCWFYLNHPDAGYANKFY